jgi:hypothetical protein
MKLSSFGQQLLNAGGDGKAHWLVLRGQVWRCRRLRDPTLRAGRDPSRPGDDSGNAHQSLTLGIVTQIPAVHEQVVRVAR